VILTQFYLPRDLDPVLLNGGQYAAAMEVLQMMQYVILPSGVIVTAITIIIFAQKYVDCGKYNQ
jgi:hypothetical protein